MSRVMTVVLALVGLFMFAGVALAQDQGGGGGGNRRGAPDPARIAQYYKEQLGVNDDEWKVIEPKLEKVRAAQREVMASRFGGFGGRGRGPGGGDQQPTTAVGKAQQELQRALEDKNTPAPQIAAKLKALRDARETAQAALVKAQKDLKDVLTARQEAVLVMRGTLD